MSIAETGPRLTIRFTVAGRKIVATISPYKDRHYIDRLEQVVKRPRALSEVRRRLWPAAKPNAVARAALDHLEASDKGWIPPAALARVQGAS